MPKRIVPLTDTKVRTIKPTDKPIKLFDGGGLFLLVTPTGGNLWNLKYRFEGKENSSTLVCFLFTTLSMGDYYYWGIVSPFDGAYIFCYHIGYEQQAPEDPGSHLHRSGEWQHGVAGDREPAGGCWLPSCGGSGSTVTFEKDGLRATFHRPHPDKAALRYRVKDARHFLAELRITP